MSDLDLDAIEARADVSTPGPWIAGWINDWKGRATVLVTLDGTQVDTTITGSIEQRDAEFIAAARQDVPALVAEVRRLRALIIHEPREQVAEQIAQALAAVPDEVYPEDVFGPVSTDDTQQIHELLKAEGLPSLDRISANIMRHAYRQAARLAGEHAKGDSDE